MNLSLHEQINEILENFDFDKCAKAMNALKWTYQDSKISPNVQELKRLANKLLQDVCTAGVQENYVAFVSCGGFKASRYGYRLELEFILEEWSVL